MGTRTSAGAAGKALAIGVVACLIIAACVTGVTGSPAGPSSSPSSAVSSGAPASPNASGASSCLIGEAWNNYAEERISEFDQPALEQQILAAGDRYDYVDAKSSVDYQVTEIGQLVAEGARVIVVRPVGQDSPALRSAIDSAVDAGVAVIVYDYILDAPKALLVAFDPVETGRMEARAILAARPKGNYAIIKGHPGGGQLEPDLIAAGIHEILQPAVDRGDITIVAETYTENWDPNTAMQEMKTILSKNQNRIDAVIAENDGLASGVIAALQEVGLDGKVAVAGQGNDVDIWNFNHVAAGTETVDIWRDARVMGKAAGDAAVALCKNPDISKLTETQPLTLSSRSQVTSILITPQAITKDNLNLVIDSGWVKKEQVCASIAPGKTPACP